MRGVELQRRIERAAFTAGGGALRAPATRASDFIARRASSTLPDSSYIPGIVPSEIAAVLDAGGLDLSSRPRRGLREFGRRLPGYVSEEAVLVGVESRTSSPVRTARDSESLAATLPVSYRSEKPSNGCPEAVSAFGALRASSIRCCHSVVAIAPRRRISTYAPPEREYSIETGRRLPLDPHARSARKNQIASRATGTFVLDLTGHPILAPRPGRNGAGCAENAEQILSCRLLRYGAALHSLAGASCRWD